MVQTILLLQLLLLNLLQRQDRDVPTDWLPSPRRLLLLLVHHSPLLFLLLHRRYASPHPPTQTRLLSLRLSPTPNQLRHNPLLLFAQRVPHAHHVQQRVHLRHTVTHRLDLLLAHHLHCGD